jgi:hypothetical protein
MALTAGQTDRLDKVKSPCPLPVHAVTCGYCCIFRRNGQADPKNSQNILKVVMQPTPPWVLCFLFYKSLCIFDFTLSSMLSNAMYWFLKAEMQCIGLEVDRTGKDKANFFLAWPLLPEEIVVF